MKILQPVKYIQSISLTISRYKRGAATEADTTNTNSPVEDEDSVLVSNQDLKEKSQARYRPVSTQLGTAEKHQRLS